MKPIISATTSKSISRVGRATPSVVACYNPCVHTIQPHPQIVYNIMGYRRFFSNTRALKKDEKTLKNLAVNLQKGTLSQEEEQKKKAKTTKDAGSDETRMSPEQTSTSTQTSTQQAESVPQDTSSPAQAQVQQAKESSNTEAIQQSTAGQSEAAAASPIPHMKPITKQTTKPTPLPKTLSSIKSRRVPGVETPRDKLTRQLMFDAYDSLAMVTYDDLKLQHLYNPDGNPPKHYLDRHALLKSIPDKININDPDDMKKVFDIYGKLAQLDDDKGMHEKHYRYLLGHLTELQRIRQQYNRIDRKFNRLRKGTVAQTSLSSSAFAADRSIPEVPYNVVGFDRSISGMPIHVGKHREEAVFPKEFIEDLANVSADGTITLHKNDWDFMEPDDRVTRVDPRSVRSINDMIRKSTTTIASPPPASTSTNTDLEDHMHEENYIYIPSIKNYRTLDYAFDETKRVKREISSMQTSLINEFQEMLRRTFPTGFYMGLDLQCKSNQFSLIDSKTDARMELPMIPLYAKFVTTKRSKRRLWNHLFKLFLINVDEHIQNVIAVSEFQERQLDKFISRVKKNIKLAIQFRCDLNSSKIHVKRNVDAVLFKPYSDRNYTRIYWIKPPHANIGIRRGAMRVKWMNIEDVLNKKKLVTKHHQHQDQPHHYHHHS